MYVYVYVLYVYLFADDLFSDSAILSSMKASTVTFFFTNIHQGVS